MQYFIFYFLILPLNFILLYYLFNRSPKITNIDLLSAKLNTYQSSLWAEAGNVESGKARCTEFSNPAGDLVVSFHTL